MVDENLWLIELSEKNRSRLLRAPFEVLAPPERVYRCVWELEAEVNNGGLHQYFFNSSGDHADFVLEALTLIGATQMREIVRQAIERVGSVALERDMITRRGLLLELPEEQQASLEELDQAFLAYPENLTSLLYRYVQVHRASIAGAG